MICAQSRTAYNQYRAQMDSLDHYHLRTNPSYPFFLGKKIMRASLWNELCRGIAWFIDNPSTYRSFALSCKSASIACREFAPHKKKEFVRLVEISKVMHAVLPDGRVHGMLLGKYFIDGTYWPSRHDGFRRGQSTRLDLWVIRKTFISRRSALPHIFPVTRWETNSIVGYCCPLCSKYHVFKHHKTNFLYYKTCLDKEYKISLRFVPMRWIRRLYIAKLVIDFAKCLRCSQGTLGF